jgi:hypothetical protein
MHKSATKCNETVGKWCKNKHGASKIIDTLEMYQRAPFIGEEGVAPMGGGCVPAPRRKSPSLHGGNPLFMVVTPSST